MTWSKQAWNECEDVYHSIIELPFVRELMNGSLPEEKFLFYLNQDALYLAEYGKILASIAGKLDKKEWREAFLHFSSDTVQVEQALHQIYLNNNKRTSQPTPTCMLYTGHMYKQLASASIQETISSILPCFWVYKVVGDYILANQTKGENRYQSWIDTYGGVEFAEAVKLAISICDEIASNSTPEIQNQMTSAFKYAFKMEWMFWQSAWDMEEWPV